MASGGHLSAWVVATMSVLGMLAFVVVSLLEGVAIDPAESLPFGLASLLFAGLGALLLVRVPGNRIGWVISAAGLTLIASGVAELLADLGVTAAHGISSAVWLSMFATLGFLMLWFPTGRPPTRRWLAVEWLGYVMLGVSIFLSTFSEQFCAKGEGGRCVAYVDNPVGVQGLPELEYGAPAVFGLFVLFVASAAVSVFVRFVRSSDVERLQLKWFAYAVGLLVGWVMVESVVELFGFAYGDSWVAAIAFALLFLGVPVSAVLAVLRYRLYDIDRVISRTVGYALVVAVLGSAYLGTVTSVARWFPVQSDLAVASATLGVVAAFTPLRRRVLVAVDRRFNRTRFIAEQELAAFAHRMRDTTDLTVIEEDAHSLIARTLRPAATTFWIGGPTKQ